jgi:hypothetical protein
MIDNILNFEIENLVVMVNDQSNGRINLFQDYDSFGIISMLNGFCRIEGDSDYAIAAVSWFTSFLFLSNQTNI